MIKLLLLGALAIGAWKWLISVRAAKPSRAQAARLLEVAPDATVEEVRAAHRRLIQRVHPDTGGSAALTAQVNAARDVLLARHTG